MNASRVWWHKWLSVNLSVNETKDACVFPSRPRPASRSNRPDTYQRLPLSTHNSLAKRSRSIHGAKSGSRIVRKPLVGAFCEAARLLSISLLASTGAVSPCLDPAQRWTDVAIGNSIGQDHAIQSCGSPGVVDTGEPVSSSSLSRDWEA
jgi:hypothetical protein